MTDRYAAMLLFGAPGVGKGTQGKILAQVPGFYHISTGDIFRTLDKQSELGQEIMGYMARGVLVPDELTVRLWRENTHARVVLGLYKPREEIMILDGLPRNVNQAQMLEDEVDVLGVVHLVCNNQDELIERLRLRAIKEKRPDDAQEEVIRRRWRVYEEETAPVLAHYDKSIVHEVDALGSPASVLEKVLEHVAPIQSKHYGE